MMGSESVYGELARKVMSIHSSIDVKRILLIRYT